MRKSLRGVQKRFSRGDIDLPTATATIQSYNGLVKHISGAGLKNIVGDTLRACVDRQIKGVNDAGNMATIC